MFKSQNGGTWTPEQNETVKFTVKGFVLENTDINLYLVNDVLLTLELDQIQGRFLQLWIQEHHLAVILDL